MSLAHCYCHQNIWLLLQMRQVTLLSKKVLLCHHPPKKKANYFITSDNVCLNHYSEAANYIKRKHMSTLGWQTALTSMWQEENSKSTHYLFIQKASQKCSLRPCSQINPLQTPTVQNLSPLIIYAVPGQAGSWSMWEECTTWLWSLGFIL